MNTQIVTRYNHLRTAVFIASWLCYAGYYLCRLGVHSAESLSGGSASLIDASWALCFFGLAYTLGNFAAGIFADRCDGRLPALIGALLSAIGTAMMATTESSHILLALQLLNGFGQGFGFPSLVKLLAAWFRRSERAGIFGWWAGSYSIGTALSMSFAPWCASTHFLFLSLGWRRSFLWPALLLAFLSICFYFTTTDTPEKAGLPPLEEATSQPARSPGWKSVLSNRDVQSVAAMYFFLKMTSYALLFGLPFYLVQQMHYDGSSARLVCSLFAILGFVGAVLANHISDRYFQQRRYPVGATMLFALAFMTMLQPLVSVLGYLAVVINISILVLLIYGTDSLMVSTCVLESVQYEESARAAAVVNGTGSIGQMLSPLLIVFFAHRHGWNNLFNFFMATALISGLILARNWNRYPFGRANEVPDLIRENSENRARVNI